MKGNKARKLMTKIWPEYMVKIVEAVYRNNTSCYCVLGPESVMELQEMGYKVTGLENLGGGLQKISW